PPQELLSRVKSGSKSANSVSSAGKNSAKAKLPQLEDFLKQRDYIGAITFLEYDNEVGNKSVVNDLWIAYCYFHLGDYSSSLKCLEKLVKTGAIQRTKGESEVDENLPPDLDDVWLFISCCQFYCGMYKEAEESVSKCVRSSRLRNRLCLHLAHKNGEEKTVMQYHQQLKDVIPDQLCLASIHFLRSHYQEAIDIYKKILIDHREYLALNVYVALCYYKLDYYDVSQEVLALYLQQHPDSMTAINLKACNHYRLYNGKAAENELRTFIESASPSFNYAKDLFRHNLVVFRNGEGALQVLPPLIDIIPEARLNLVIYYLKQDDYQEAFNLISDLEPSVPHEYILKGVVNAVYGQEQGSREHLKAAQQYFQLVGGSASECDTIPGRQSMASCFFLMKQFDDVLLYLSSIKSYFYNDDTFNFAFAQAKAATNSFTEAEETFLLIQSDKIKNDAIYINWLLRSYIMNKKPEKAWELYETVSTTSSDTFSHLTLLANDCYK
ncbi:Tetratricopeptide repeat protein 26-like protein, partial [Leptotrombidium deliense]